MIPKNSTLRIARPTDNLTLIREQYIKGLGFSVLGEFFDHNGFDGVILGHGVHPYHLEFTHHKGAVVGRAPSKDHLLVFYIPEKGAWDEAKTSMESAGFQSVESYNPYWEFVGSTYEDVDGYRVVLQNS